MMDDEDGDIGAGFEEMAAGAQIPLGGGDKKDPNKSKVESIISSNAATHFSPNGDMELIREIMAQKDIASRLAYLRNMYVQYPVSKMIGDMQTSK